MLEAIYTRTIVPTNRFVAKILAFGGGGGAMKVLDDCEILMTDWDHEIGIDANHERAAQNLAINSGAPCGFSLTEQDTGEAGLRKWVIE